MPAPGAAVGWDLGEPPPPSGHRGYEPTVIRPGGAAPRPLGAPATARATLTLDTGVQIEAGSFGVLGRGPSMRAGDPPGQVVPVDDEAHSVSKTHLAFGVDADGFWVTDRGSTNGTRVELAGNPAQLCPSGERVYAPDGARVYFGDRWFDVARAPATGTVPGIDAHRQDERRA